MQTQDIRGSWRCEGRRKAHARTDTLLERSAKNTKRGAGEQEKMRKQQLPRQQKLLEMVTWWVEEEKRKQMCSDALKSITL